MSGIVQIEPIAIPQAAALDYSGGDVRHLSSIADALGGDALSNPTRQLAFRDVLLAEKLNQLIQVVNNKDQFIPIPLPATTLPGGATQVITNYRIPPGFEARVLNAKVSSTPSKAIQLRIGYNANIYGLTTSTTTAVSTLDEFSAGSSFYGTGEFVISFINTSGRTATATASIMLTMRPVAAQKGGIIGPGAVGAQGAKGEKGEKGDQGNPGLPGSAGPIGITWRGTWSSITNYATRDGAEYNGSSWYAKSPNTNTPPPTNPATASAIWDLITKVGSQGFQGFQGNQGTQGAGFQGAQGATGAQGFQGFQGADGQDGAQGSQGSQGDQGVTGNQGVQGPAGSPGTTVGALFSSKSPSTAIETGGTYTPGQAKGIYGSIASGSNYGQFDWFEANVYNGISSPFIGMSVLRGVKRAVFNGTVTVGLPKIVDGATQEWYGSNVQVNITPHGTLTPMIGGDLPTVEVHSVDSQSFSVVTRAIEPAQVQISVFGTKMWPQ